MTGKHDLPFALSDLHVKRFSSWVVYLSVIESLQFEHLSVPTIHIKYKMHRKKDVNILSCPGDECRDKRQ